MDELQTYLQRYASLSQAYFTEISGFLRNEDLQKLALELAESRSAQEPDEFNVFTLVSDIYYRENFHSDLLKAFLDPTGSHREGHLFLLEFLRYLNAFNHNGVRLDFGDYRQAEVFREKGRIDVLILDHSTKKAIIIENKINKASDMHRQIPRYVEELEKRGFVVDAVVYLLLNYHLKPSTADWAPEERLKLLPKIISVAASTGQKDDFLNGWLMVCLDKAASADNKFILKHYYGLVRQLGKQVMDKQLMERFYQTMQEEKNFQTALSVRNMINDLQLYRAQRIVDTFAHDHYPFTNAWVWANRAAVLDNFYVGNNAFAIDILPEERAYRFQFFQRGINTLPLKELLDKIDQSRFFQPVGERMQRVFQYPAQENEMYTYIIKLRKLLGDYQIVEAKRLENNKDISVEE